MGIKLQGKKFFMNENNGVVAVVEELVFLNGQKRRALYKRLVDKHPPGSYERNQGGLAFNGGLDHLRGIPVFTFAAPDRTADSPWFTGSTVLFDSLRRHILAEGGEVLKAPAFVPFSNGVEVGQGTSGERVAELKYITTEHQFLETFGATIAQVLDTYT